MNAMVAATDEQMSMLDGLVSSIQSVEQTLAGVLATRDGLLALAGKLALSMAEDGDGIDASDLTIRTVAAEVGAVLRVSDRTVQRRMAEASITVERFPLVWAAQGAGQISAGHARVIVDAGAHLDDAEARAAYSARVLEFAEDESPNRLRPIAARIAEQYQPRSLEERHADARKARGVWVKDAPDAMAELGLLGPAALVHAAFDRLTGMAKADAGASVGTAGVAFGLATAPESGDSADLRTLSQKRSDLALDLLLTGAPAGHDTPDGLLAAIVPHVSVTVPVTTLMGAEGAETPPAELDGRTPIDLETARLLAGAASGWDRILTHPISGALLAADRYRPSAHLRRHLRARDQRCRFPGCGMPPRNSDLDHTLDAAFGRPTEEENLAELCRRHHVLKHHSPWHVEQVGGGLLEWTSPTGRVYIDKPPPPNTVTFAETGPPPDPVDLSDPVDLGDPADPWASVPDELLAPF
ncbi:hypothetical protein QF046_002476 [Microbacterium sp. W4I4]|uniref:HNH endonuclease signature motif containing protein n=1 Tax=Microbacterium sp. W4I4 TaxID=3042295 RepID=UPI002787A697|nr:HNH endonuclease signature motif containing protein [Microbacterium sp. W4I4]MDQ0614835.1 hypothetical protein [Microbacterium sp. W4I4]